MKSKILIILGTIITLISIIFITKDKIIEYKAGINSQIIINNINNNNNVIKKNNEKMDTITIKGNNYIGTIIIPTININLPVQDTWNNTKLQISPCLYYGSIHTNNMIICGHSYKKHFKDLEKLTKSDYIIFKDVSNNQYIYEVKEIQILEPTNIEEMINTNFELTLYTCTKDGLKRITIRCKRI